MRMITVGRIKSIRKALRVKKVQNYYREFRKATEGMESGDRDMLIDNHVMDFIHHLFHDIEENAQNYGDIEDKIEQIENEARDSRETLKTTEKHIGKMMRKLSEQFSEYRLSNPDQLAQTHHIIEQHPILQEIVTQLMQKRITPEQATSRIINNIDKHDHHDRESLESSQFSKSSGANFGMFGLYSFPSYPVATSASSMSRFRPSPPFLINTTPTPDERFIEAIIKLKSKDEEGEIRPRTPVDNAHETLAEQAGIPHFLIPAKKVGEQPMQKSSVVVDMIRNKMYYPKIKILGD